MFINLVSFIFQALANFSTPNLSCKFQIGNTFCISLVRVNIYIILLLYLKFRKTQEKIKFGGWQGWLARSRNQTKHPVQSGLISTYVQNSSKCLQPTCWAPLMPPLSNPIDITVMVYLYSPLICHQYSPRPPFTLALEEPLRRRVGGHPQTLTAHWTQTSTRTANPDITPGWFPLMNPLGWKPINNFIDSQSQF